MLPPLPPEWANIPSRGVGSSNAPSHFILPVETQVTASAGTDEAPGFFNPLDWAQTNSILN